MSESFVHLGIGNRYKTYLGIQQEIKPVDFGQDYVSITSTLKGIISAGKYKEGATKVAKGDFVQLIADLEIRPSKCRALIVPNQELSKHGIVSYQHVKEAGDKPGILLGFLAAEDVDLKDLGWLVRIYALV
jgi:hypothetical protein